MTSHNKKSEEKQVMSMANRVAAQFQENHNQAVRVADRFQKEAVLGETITQGKVRIHHYANQLAITDLDNAGKRGKSCRQLKVGPRTYQSNVAEMWLDNSLDAIKSMKDFDKVKDHFEKMFDASPDDMFMDETLLRGVDVLPAETKTIKLNWGSANEGQMSLTATPLSFLVKSTVFYINQGKDKSNSFAQDTLYGPASKKDAAVFYSWLSANESEVQKMTIEKLRILWHDLKVRYDAH